MGSTLRINEYLKRPAIDKDIIGAFLALFDEVHGIAEARRAPADDPHAQAIALSAL
jgi:hypothetical protein